MRVLAPPRIGRGSAGVRLTPEEFDLIDDYDDNYRYELIDGVLVVNPIPNEGEAAPNDELGHLIRCYQKQHPLGAAVDATLPERYIRSKKGRRRADRVIWTGLGRTPDPSVDIPSIAVEFVSRAKRDQVRDYKVKKREYRRVGVQEYWVVDRFRRTMTVYRFSAEGVVELTFGEADVYRTPLMPGFELRIQELFAAADPWAN